MSNSTNFCESAQATADATCNCFVAFIQQGAAPQLNQELAFLRNDEAVRIIGEVAASVDLLDLSIKIEEALKNASNLNFCGIQGTGMQGPVLSTLESAMQECRATDEQKFLCKCS